MKSLRLKFALFVLPVLALAGFAVLDSTAGRGQSGEARKIVRGRVVEASLTPSNAPDDGRTAVEENTKVDSEEAAARNAVLRNELTWTFGGKQQRGWYLYIPLLSQLLHTEDNPTSPEFASAVSRWQKKSGLRPTGVIDEESLYAMISKWQSRRLKDRNVAQMDQLITAPPSDFYDPSRSPELRMVERKTYDAYKRMIAAAAADSSLNLNLNNGNLAPGERYLKIVSSFRSREYQDRLRRESPNAGSAGLAINSPHFTGRALDLYVGGDPVEAKDANRAIQVQTRAYQWLVRNAERFGFRPYFYEPWHWEYVD